MIDNSSRGHRELKELVAKAILEPSPGTHSGVRGASEDVSAYQSIISPQQFMVLIHQWNYDAEVEKQSSHNCIRQPSSALLDLHLLGVLPRVSQERIKAATFLDDRKIILGDENAILRGIAALCGDLELSKEEEQGLKHALDQWRVAMDLERRIISRGKTYTDEECTSLYQARVASAEAFHAFTDHPMERDDREVLKLLGPTKGYLHRLAFRGMRRRLIWR